MCGVKLWIIAGGLLVLIAVEQARTGEMRVLPYAALVFLAIVGLVFALWFLASWLNPE